MRRGFVFFELLAVALLAAGGVPRAIAAEDFKVAVIDMKFVFNSHPGTATAEVRVQKARDEVREAFIERTNALKSILQKHQEKILQLEKASGDDALTKQKEAADLLEEARQLEREVAEFKTKQEADLKKRFLDEKRQIVDSIKDAVTAFNADGKYQLILDKSAAAANGMPTVVDVRGLDDITEKIIARLK